MDSSFKYQPSLHVPFRDMEAIARCRQITAEQIVRHPNPDFRIRVLSADEMDFIWVADMFRRIKESDEYDRPAVLILPNPCPSIYRKVVHLVNLFKVSCRRLHVFAMDEYANEEGRIAPESWPSGFMYSLLENLFKPIDAELRPPREQFHGLSNKNLDNYGRMIADLGGADVCYSGPGWTGHLAFVEPDAPEFNESLVEWRRLGPRICTLSPFTLAQNSLHGSFGMSGDIAAVPPRAATIGPAEVIGAKHRIELAGLTIHGTATSWQRMIARLCYHGPVTPLLPSSIHQELRTDCYISDMIAREVVRDLGKGY